MSLVLDPCASCIHFLTWFSQHFWSTFTLKFLGEATPQKRHDSYGCGRNRVDSRFLTLRSIPCSYLAFPLFLQGRSSESSVVSTFAVAVIIYCCSSWLTLPEPSARGGAKFSAFLSPPHPHHSAGKPYSPSPSLTNKGTALSYEVYLPRSLPWVPQLATS